MKKYSFLSKKERHEIYCFMLKEIEKFQPQYIGGFCSLFKFYCFEKNYPTNYSLENLLELYSKKPLINYEFVWWFDPFDVSSRVSILEKCIEETKPLC